MKNDSQVEICGACLEQFIVLKNDPEMEYFFAPGTIQSCMKSDSQAQYEIIWRLAQEQFIALKSDSLDFRSGIFLCA